MCSKKAQEGGKKGWNAPRIEGEIPVDLLTHAAIRGQDGHETAMKAGKLFGTKAGHLLVCQPDSSRGTQGNRSVMGGGAMRYAV